MTGQLFRSYSRVDASRSTPLVQGIEAEGFPVWQDVGQIRVGEIWSEEIESAIKDSVCMALLLSKRSVKSPLVTNEWKCALENRIPVLTLRIDEVEVPQELQHLHHISLLRFLDIDDTECTKLPEDLLTVLGQYSFRLDAPRLETENLHTIRWSTIHGAKSYLAQVSATKDFADAEEHSLESYIRDFANPDLHSNRFVRVKAVGSALSDSDWSQVVELRGLLGELDRLEEKIRADSANLQNPPVDD